MLNYATGSTILSVQYRIFFSRKNGRKVRERERDGDIEIEIEREREKKIRERRC